MLDEHVETAVYARTLATDVLGPDGEVLLAAGVDLGDVNIRLLVDNGVTTVKVRSVLTCEAVTGTCAMCYGRSLASGKLVDVGEAVGIVAAQSIGEPGTQLTMRTFHTGGVAGDDITQGLPRVVELFEARQPKGKAPISESTGRVAIEDNDRLKKIVITPDDGSEAAEFTVSRRARLLVEDGDHVQVGQQLTAGTPDPHDVLRVLGVRRVQEHLVDEVQSVYRTQGAPIHDKHIEIIIRQMLRRVTVIESGDSDLLAGDLVDRLIYEAQNRTVVAEGGAPASGRAVLMGITKASLATESWLSAASFQETTKVLTDAAIHGKSDSLRRPQGERHPGQADPGRHRPGAVPQHPGGADGGGQGAGVLDGRLRLVRLRLRSGVGRGRAAGGVRPGRLPLGSTHQRGAGSPGPAPRAVTAPAVSLPRVPPKPTYT